MSVVEPTQFITDFDLHLFAEGTHYRTYEKLGAHIIEQAGVRGTHFAVWAPNATDVYVIGDFNGWSHAQHPLYCCGHSGVWAGFIPGVEQEQLYKFNIRSRSGSILEKMDPYAFACEVRPKTASKVYQLDGYDWKDSRWMEERFGKHQLSAPISIYEVHLGSWMRSPDDGSWLGYRDIADKLAAYVREMGYTHVELLPVSEHPLDASWGYQTVGYYAATSRYGSPQDFMYFVDVLHQQDIGIILDWVPAHFPDDGHALSWFDGTHLFEHEDPRKGRHQDWGTLIFNYGRLEVKNFLISNALFWFDKYHIDGLRVDAVASMLYLDYSRKSGEWVPNEYGGRENIEAIHFVRELNERVYGEYPDALMFAEESTAWGMVSRPTSMGGLGFGLKWDMGWMHDTLKYFTKEPVHRKYHHHELTFRMLYAFTENFVLPLSHDEVVHGKGAMLSKMPGDDWQKFANLRLLYGYMFTQPGKKLLFMGGELGQWYEWNFEACVDWHLLDEPRHAGLQRWVRDLNTLYRAESALHVNDVHPEGYEWIDCNDADQSVLSYIRKGQNAEDVILVICNFTPVLRHKYRVGVPQPGYWKEILNSDARIYWGSGQGNFGGVHSGPIAWHQRSDSVLLTLPPLGVIALKYIPDRNKES